MTLRTQLLVAFGAVAMIPLVGGAIGIFSQRHATQHARELLQTAEASRHIVDVARRAQVALNAAASEFAAAQQAGADATVRQSRIDRLRQAERTTSETLTYVANDAAEFGIERRAIEAVRSAIADLTAKYDMALTDSPSAPERSEALLVAATRLSGRLDELVRQVCSRADARIEASRKDLESKRAFLENVMLFGTFAGIALGVFFGWMTSNAVVRHLRGLAGRMQDRTVEVAAAAGQVSTSSATVANTSAEQAAAIETSSASIAEVNARVRENADRARQAREVSQTSRAAAEESSSEIAELQAAMTDTVAANANITKIVKSIDEIAFQTNLLALNAAVEAARAGEAGTGFAVVADEVRNLAQRSAHAARETAEKIENATAKSARGAELADRVGQSLKRVVENTRTVDTLVREIADASVEQATGLEQAVTSMQQIDQLTQSNAAAAEETAAAAEALDGQANQLRTELAGLLDRRARVLTVTAATTDVEKQPEPEPLVTL